MEISQGKSFWAYFINSKFIIPDQKINYSKKIRLTLDYPEDYELAKELFQKLKKNFSLEDIVEVFNEHPQLKNRTESLNEKWEDEYERKITDFSLKK